MMTQSLLAYTCCVTKEGIVDRRGHFFCCILTRLLGVSQQKNSAVTTLVLSLRKIRLRVIFYRANVKCYTHVRSGVIF